MTDEIALQPDAALHFEAVAPASQRRLWRGVALLVYALLYTAFAVGARRVPDVGLHPGAAARLVILGSAVSGALVSLVFIYLYSDTGTTWQESWKRYGRVFIVGGLLDLGCNFLAHPTAPRTVAPDLALALIGIANLGMLLCAVAMGLIVAQGMKSVNHLVTAAVVGALTDMVSVFMGPTKHNITTDVFYYLSFQWGILGLSDVQPVVGMGDFIFIALFFVGVRRFGWKAQRTLIALGAALTIGFVLAIYGPREATALPALPFLGAGLLVAHGGDIRRARAAARS